MFYGSKVSNTYNIVRSEVKHAISLKLADLYEHRGGEEGIDLGYSIPKKRLLNFCNIISHLNGPKLANMKSPKFSCN